MKRSFSSRFYLIAILSFLFFLDAFVLWYSSQLDYNRTLERARLVLQQTSISLEERVKRTVIASEAILHNRAQRIQDVGIEKTISSRKRMGTISTGCRRAAGCRIALVAGRQSQSPSGLHTVSVAANELFRKRVFCTAKR